MLHRYPMANVLWVALAICLSAVAQEKQEIKETPNAKAAKSIVQQLEKGKFEEVAKSFDATMQEALPTEQLKTT